ncbi:MAG: MATE family efflux transporter [Rhodobacteraceae bacterium]|nr:MATE family efflux transporter [Paracoccaceae bacterium]MCY4197424.1 MATE family efflux transporter [Paracoccaceae bacterium]
MQEIIGKNFKQQLWLTLSFSAPLIGSNLAQASKQLTDAAMLGHYGVDELAAGVLAGTIFLITFVVGSGFAMAAIPLASEARGAGLTWKLRRIIRMSFWLSTTYWLLLFMPLHHIETVLLLLGQEPTIARLAGEYMAIAVWGIFPAMTVMVLKSFFVALGKPKIIFWATLLGALINVPANYMFIFGNWGAPELGIAGAAYATIFAHGLTLSVMLLYLLIDGDCRTYSLFARLWKPEWKILGSVFQLGWPVSVTLTSEIGLFAAGSVMAGWVGTISLAAHGIVLETAAFVFMIYLGFANAATAQAGFAVGARSRAALGRVTRAVLTLTGLTVVVVVIIFISIPELLVRAFLDTESEGASEVLRIGITLVFMGAAFQLADAFQVVALGLLRGLSDTRMPMIIAAISYSLVGLPVSYVAGFVIGWGAVGIWCGFIAGLAIAAVWLLFRFRRKLRSLDF